MTLKFWVLSDGRTELFFNNQDVKGYKRRGALLSCMVCSLLLSGI